MIITAERRASKPAGQSPGCDSRHAQVHTQAYATDSALTAGFNWYRTFSQDAAANKEANSQAPIATRLLYLRGEKEGGQINDLCRAKIGTWSLSWLFVLSGCSAILADQASDGVLAFDPGSEIDGLAGFLQRRSLLPRLMGPVRVVMSRVLGQDAPEMLLAVDQHVIETLAAQRSHIPVQRKNLPAVTGPEP